MDRAPAPGTPEELSVAVGQDFQVELDAQPTAGYRWRLREPLPEGIELREASIEPGHRPGAPARQAFAFRATEPGDRDLVLDYARPWEPEPVASRHLIVHAA